jgi:predicted ArsR family transcriptional regulator
VLCEKHCAICAAATSCQKFCSSELEVFQRVLGPEVRVQRTEHILSGARQCTYLISEKQ